MDSFAASSLSLFSSLTVSDQTGSRSNASAGSKDVDGGIVEQTISPVDLENQIQTERIIAILDEAIHKAKLAAVLPNLIEEYTLLSSVLTEDHLQNLTDTFEQCDNEFFTGLGSSYGFDELVTDHYKLAHLEQMVSPELTNLVYILSRYPALNKPAEQILNLMKHKYPESSEDYPKILQFIEALELLKEKMVLKMSVTAGEQLRRKMHLRNVTLSNEVLAKKATALKELLIKEQTEFARVMTEKEAIISKHRDELAILREQCTLGIKKTILDSERQMVLATRSHVVKQEMLLEEEVETQDHYDILLKTNLDSETALRNRKNKVQTQLTSWIQKYDIDIGDKQRELDDLTDLHEEEERLIEILERQIEEQNEEYIPLMAEREREYEEELLNKMRLFLQEHAARVIQHAWRSVLAARQEKRKQRKLAAKLAKEEKKRAIEEMKQKKREMKEAKRLRKEAREAAKLAKKERKQKLKEEKEEGKIEQIE